MGVSWQIAMSETSGGIRPCGGVEGGWRAVGTTGGVATPGLVGW